MTLPPLPAWQAIHPLIIHFPIALLLIAPLFIAIGAVRKPERSYSFLLFALILMAIGTVSTFVAASSGEAAGRLVENAPQVKGVLEQHEELAESTEIVFSALTLIFASILFVPRLLKLEPARAISTVLPLVFLLFYATGAISLANTAHQGGRLVHELGVTAQVQPHAFGAETAECDEVFIAVLF
ncbi:MAG: DUF2231 domain-containing protein [Bryobacteraceae bacterium]